jgi:hypothetical protein
MGLGDALTGYKQSRTTALRRLRTVDTGLRKKQHYCLLADKLSYRQ